MSINNIHAVDGAVSSCGFCRRNQTGSCVAALMPCLLKQTLSISLTFAQSLQRIVIKMTGVVTFYTSFEVQPVTTIM